MLVLTRRLGEAITISDNIKLVIVDLDGTQVKIGIEAPRDVEIFREELYEKIKGRQFPVKTSVNISRYPKSKESK
jgi:carbon storage regulator